MVTDLLCYWCRNMVYSVCHVSLELCEMLPKISKKKGNNEFLKSIVVLLPKDVDGIANSVGPDHTAPLGAV